MQQLTNQGYRWTLIIWTFQLYTLVLLVPFFKFQTGSLNRHLKHMIDSQANFQWTNNKIPCSFCTFETTKENIVWSSAIGKNIIHVLLIKGNSLVTSAAEQLKFLVWKWCQMNNLIAFEKPSIIKSWLFLQH